MKSELKATVLGCGSSGGVPRIGGPGGVGDWGVCDAGEPRNRRMRCSLLIERAADGAYPRDGVTSILVDTSPDMRAQLLAARVERLDAVLITHDHADQTHGLDDLRALAIRNRRRMPVHFDRETAGQLPVRFSYCFEQAEGSWYPPILEEVRLPAVGETDTIDGPSGAIPFTPFMQEHGAVRSHGFRFGDLAYSADVVDLQEESFEILAGVRIWIVDCLQMTPHGSHAHYEKTLAWIDRVRPERAVLTNLHVTMDYRTLLGMVPAGVEPAFDGMELRFSA
ncbi:MAG: MBL fold metallo-hydrolase [Alphaproteobacteria bacterium]|nr:MBL fold metallo-hydrolase [Alphaproteobacteria bacterium]